MHSQSCSNVEYFDSLDMSLDQDTALSYLGHIEPQDDDASYTLHRCLYGINIYGYVEE